MRQMTKILGGLTVVAVPTIASAAPIAISSSQVAWDQNPFGVDVRVRYDIASDAYYLNADRSNAFMSGYASGLSATDYGQRWVEDSTTGYLCAGGTGPWGTFFQWTFDVSATGSTIQSATVCAPSAAYDDGGHQTSVVWTISTDNGLTWRTIYTLNSYDTNTTTYDLTSDVQGKTSYILRADLHKYWSPTHAQIFRSGYGDFDNQIWLNSAPAPEPASLGVLALGGFALLARRRSR